MAKKYVVLGGAGSFGIHQSDYLLKHADAERVISIGRGPVKPAPYSLGVGDGDPRYSYHALHVVNDFDKIIELFDRERPQVFINYAALAEVPTSWKHPEPYYEVNCMALIRMTEELRKRDYLERWIQIGTSELYGSVSAPANEDTPLSPSSPYAVSKAVGDMHLVSISKFLNFPMNILRPSNAYCPGQPLYRILPRTVTCGLMKTKFPLQGGGKAKKSYIHAFDVAKAAHLIAEKAPLGQVYNAGPELPISIRELVEKTADVMGIKLEDLCDIVPDRFGQDSQYWLDSSRIKNELGWKPEVSLEAGLEDMVNWGKKYLPQLRTMSQDYDFFI